FLDPPPGGVALVVAYAFDLVEARDCVAHVAGLVERLPPLLGECELVLVEVVALLFVEFRHRCLLLAHGKRPTVDGVRIKSDGKWRWRGLCASPGRKEALDAVP